MEQVWWSKVSTVVAHAFMGALLYWRARRTDLENSKAIYDCYMCGSFPDPSGLGVARAVCMSCRCQHLGLSCECSSAGSYGGCSTLNICCCPSSAELQSPISFSQ